MAQNQNQPVLSETAERLSEIDIGDNHEALLEYESNYERNVQFYVGGFDSPSPTPSPEYSGQQRFSFSPEVQASLSKRKMLAARCKSDIGMTNSNVTHSQNGVSKNGRTSLMNMSESDTKLPGNVNESGKARMEMNVPQDRVSSYDFQDSVSVKCLSKGEIMELYAKREKAFSDAFLNKMDADEQKSPNKCSRHQSSAMAHLGNVIRIMEHLSRLKEENAKLRKRCAYLEDTTSLLESRNRFLQRGAPHREHSVKEAIKEHIPHLSLHFPVTHRPFRSHSDTKAPRKVSDTSDMHRKRYDSDHAEVKSDPSTPRPLQPYQRSHSMGSIDMVDLDLPGKQDEQEEEDTKETKKSSRWKRMKKVFGGKLEPESPKVESITAERLMRSNSRSPQISNPKLISVKSMDSEMLGFLSMDKVLTAGDKVLCRSIPQLSELKPPQSPSSIDLNVPMVVTSLSKGEGEFGNEDMELSTSRSFSSASDKSNIDDANSEVQAAFESTPKDNSSKNKNRFLKVNPNLMMRRKSSPTLSCSDDTASLEINVPRSPRIGRSSSFKDQKERKELYQEGESRLSRYSDTKRSLKDTGKAAWGRVKDIIHHRRDSLKKSARSQSLTRAGTQSPATSSDNVNFQHEQLIRKSSESPRPYSPDSPEVLTPQRSHQDSLSPCDSPTSDSPCREASTPVSHKARSGRPRLSKQETVTCSSPSKQEIVCSSSPSVDLTALMGGMSDDWNKKMLEWEEKKGKGLGKVGSQENQDEEANFTDEFIRKMEEWERIKGHQKEALPQSPGSPVDGSSPQPNMEDLEKHLSESFTKTVKQWERVKTKRVKETGSPTPDNEGGHENRRVSKGNERFRSRKKERSKSYDNRDRSRSKSKYEKQRERELQKIEKKEQKIEKDKQKLEHMKRKLDEMEGTGDARYQGLSDEFAQKLAEWELMKGLKPGQGQSSLDSGHHRSQSVKRFKDDDTSPIRARAKSESTVNGHYLLRPSTDTGPPPIEDRLSTSQEFLQREPSFSKDVHVVDDSTSIDINITAENIARLEEANQQLADEVEDKEEDILIMQDELQQLTNRINDMNKQHYAEIDNYKQELWASSSLGHYTLETDKIAASVEELKCKIHELQHYGDALVMQKVKLEEAVLCKEQEKADVQKHHLEGMEIDDMGSSKNTAAKDFEKIYKYLKNLQSQLADLREGILERNNALGKVKHHLQNQGVNNKLLQAEVYRRDLQVQFYKEARRTGIIRRWKTFHGKDIIIREDGSMFLKNGTTVPLKVDPNDPYSQGDLEAILSEVRHGHDLKQQEVDWDWMNALKREKLAATVAKILLTSETQTANMTQDAVVQTFLEHISTLQTKPTSSQCKSVQTSLTDLYQAVLRDQTLESFSSSTPLSQESPQGLATQSYTKYPVENGGSHVDDNPDIVEISYKFPTPPDIHCSPFANVSGNTRVSEVDSSDPQLYEPTGVGAASAGQSQSQDFVPEEQVLFYQEMARRRHSSGASCSSEVFHTNTDQSPSSPLPHSPIVRSKYQRKQRSDGHVNQNCSDPRTWKATPPRRFITRHRAMSSDQSTPSTTPSSPTENIQCIDIYSDIYSDDVMRDRTKSDTSTIMRRPSVLIAQSVLDEQSKYTDPHKQKQLPVQDMISKFENRSRSSSASHGCLSPFKSRSPSPLRKPTRSPVRRLKTAAELIEDSQKRLSKDRSKSVTAVEGCGIPVREILHATNSSSSDKENESKVKVKQMVEHLSRENTPNRESSPQRGETPRKRQSEAVKAVLRRLSFPNADEPKPNPPLQDLTNEGKVRKLSEAFGSSGTENPEGRKKSSSTIDTDFNVIDEKSDGAKLKSVATDFISSVRQTHPEERKVVNESIKPESTMTSGLSPTPRVRAGSADSPVWKARASGGDKRKHMAGGSVSNPSTPSPIIKDRKVHKLFARRQQTAKPKPSAISALCVQALSVDVLNPVTDPTSDTKGLAAAAPLVQEEEMSPSADRRRRHGKLLDARWLQKPKKFFKVSKC